MCPRRGTGLEYCLDQNSAIMFRNFFNSVHDILTINETYIFEGSEQEFEKALVTSASKAGSLFTAQPQRRQKNTFIVTNLISWGTLEINDRAGSPIKLNITYTRLSESQQQIKVYTDIRKENWFLLATSLFAITISIYLGMDPANTFMIILLFIVCFLWFNYIYRVQERSLLDKVINGCGLKES